MNTRTVSNLSDVCNCSHFAVVSALLLDFTFLLLYYQILVSSFISYVLTAVRNARESRIAIYLAIYWLCSYIHSCCLSLEQSRAAQEQQRIQPNAFRLGRNTEDCLSEDSKRIALLQCIKIIIIMIKTSTHQLNTDDLTLHLPVDGI